MDTMFLLAISSARRSFYITNPYFLPDPRMTRALIEAAGRGVRVVALLPGAIDNNIVRHASRSKFGELLQAGIEIYEYQPRLLHAKVMTVDGILGDHRKHQLDSRSFALNEEAQRGHRQAVRLPAPEIVDRRRPAAARRRTTGRLNASGDRGSSDGEAICRQQDDRADDRHDEPDGIAILVQTDQTADVPTDDSTHHSDEGGDDEPTRIATRHEELGNEADDETEHDPSKNVHGVLLSLKLVDITRPDHWMFVQSDRRTKV
jgi:PLD-like domain